MLELGAALGMEWETPKAMPISRVSEITTIKNSMEKWKMC